MKIDNNTLQNMQKDILVIIKYHKIDPKKLNVHDINNLWFHAYMNRSYLDNNVNVKKDNLGKRILPYIENFELYPCNTNDTTIYTAFKQILNNIQK
ncbi:MAG: hypothetical protein PHN56_04015 [Candidatus Nanoarchaeia archaeon]|nr:hypothetical protein [Candidatus Nanoarchaeia archaeon]